ncbi:hypothetical protein SRHO_G00284620 [Serrasalmus rhombeus]
MVLELAAPASAGPSLQRCIPHIERVFRVKVSCRAADPQQGACGGVLVNIGDGTEEDCTKAKVRRVCVCVCAHARECHMNEHINNTVDHAASSHPRILLHISSSPHREE